MVGNLEKTTVANFKDTARVWLYQANRVLTDSEIQIIEPKLSAFVDEWTCHGSALIANGLIYEKLFIVLIVDESVGAASGCSIDKSVAFMQLLEREIGIQLFDRMMFSYQNEKGEVEVVSRDVFKELYESGKINENTLVYDPLVKDVASLKNDFLKPIKESWHKRMV